MSKAETSLVTRAVCKSYGVSEVGQIDPVKLQKWMQIIMQLLPIFMTFFSQPAPAPIPPPVQAGAAITTIEGLMEYVEKTMELRSLTEEQQTKVLNAVEALAAFLTI